MYPEIVLSQRHDDDDDGYHEDPTLALHRAHAVLNRDAPLIWSPLYYQHDMDGMMMIGCGGGGSLRIIYNFGSQARGTIIMLLLLHLLYRESI